nr:helix-turn-helix domain-containing protein [Nonomuraea sp. SYSU D8015]
MIHTFNERGLAALDPRWAGGRPRLISDEDIAVIIQTAKTPPARLGCPFTHWSVRKLAEHLIRYSERTVVIGREHLRRLLHQHGVTFQRTRTWKTSTDPDFDAKLDRIEEVTSRFPNRCFAFDQFGPLSIRPFQGAGWAERGKPDRLPATYTRTHGVCYFHGCYSLGDDTLWGITRRGKNRRQHAGRLEIDPGRTPRRRPDLRHPGTCRPTRHRRSAPGRPRTRSNCASPRPTLPGPTRSSRSSDRCAPS